MALPVGTGSTITLGVPDGFRTRSLLIHSEALYP